MQESSCTDIISDTNRRTGSVFTPSYSEIPQFSNLAESTTVPSFLITETPPGVISTDKTTFGTNQRSIIQVGADEDRISGGGIFG